MPPTGSTTGAGWARTARSRPLHVDKALDVIDFAQVEPTLRSPVVIAEEPGFRRELLCHNRYFTTERLTLAAGAEFRGVCNGDTLEMWGVIEGSVMVNELDLDAVRFCLLPAALGEYVVRARTAATLLRTYVEGDADK